MFLRKSVFMIYSLVSLTLFAYTPSFAQNPTQERCNILFEKFPEFSNRKANDSNEGAIEFNSGAPAHITFTFCPISLGAIILKHRTETPNNIIEYYTWEIQNDRTMSPAARPLLIFKQNPEPIIRATDLLTMNYAQGKLTIEYYEPLIDRFVLLTESESKPIRSKL